MRWFFYADIGGNVNAGTGRTVFYEEKSLDIINEEDKIQIDFTVGIQRFSDCAKTEREAVIRRPNGRGRGLRGRIKENEAPARNQDL